MEIVIKNIFTDDELGASTFKLPVNKTTPTIMIATMLKFKPSINDVAVYDDFILET